MIGIYMMNLKMKTYLLGTLLAITVFIVLVVAGYFLFGSTWMMTGFPFIAFATGIASYVLAQRHISKNL
jgi:hypothetical protein